MFKINYFAVRNVEQYSRIFNDNLILHKRSGKPK